MKRTSRLENLLRATRYRPAEPAPGSVTAVRVLIVLQGIPLLLLMILGGWSAAAYLAPVLVIGGALVWLTFVRRRLSYGLIAGVEVIALLLTLLATLVGLIGATMSQGGPGFAEVMLVAVLFILSAIVTLLLLWSAQLHDHFNL